MYVGYECNYNIEKSIENKIQIGREGDEQLQIVFSLYIWLIYICDSNLRESKKEKKNPHPNIVSSCIMFTTIMCKYTGKRCFGNEIH